MTGISAKDFTTIYTLSRMSSPDATAIDNGETQRVLEFYDSVSEKAAKDVLARWRRDVDYLKAIRELAVGP